MLLKPVAQIKVSIAGYVWNDVQRLVPLEDFSHTMEDGTPVPLDEWERELHEMDRTYDPFDSEPGLFLQFSRLDPTPDAILEFATKYGSLDNSSLSNWTRTITRLRSAVALWEAITRQDPELLSQHVQWVGPRLEIINPLARRIISSGEDYETPRVMPGMSPPVPMGNYHRGDLLQPARDTLQWILRLGKFSGGKTVAAQPRPGEFRFELQIKSLRDVLWLQWLMAVCENQAFYNCEYCRRPIRLTPEKTRRDRRYCSNACQMRAYRERMAKAKQMRRNGRHLREIAKVVGSDVATVKKWVGEA